MRIPINQAFLVLLLGAVVSGCRTSPDVEPFAEATWALETVMVSLGKPIAEEIRSTHDGTEVSLRTAGEEAAKFEEEWGRRERVIKALSEYARTLVDAVQAGKQGGKTAMEIGSAVNGLLKTVAESYPAGSPAVDTVTNGVATLFARYAEHEAAKTVAEASEFAEPLVAELAKLIAEDFQNLVDILDAARINADTAALEKANRDKDHQRLKSLEEERRKLKDRPLTNVLDDAALFEKTSRVEGLIDIELRRPWYLEYQAAVAANKERFDALSSTVQHAAVLLQAWGESHTQLTQAAQTGITPAYRVLLSLTSDLLQVYQEARKV